MEFQDVIRKRRSVRHFIDRDVSDEIVFKLLDAAHWAPTGGNSQPWEFILVRDRANRKRLVDATFLGYMTKTGKPQSWILEAPVIIAACANTKTPFARYGSGEMTRTNLLLDVAAAIENLLLAAVDLGLGACWISGFDRDKVKEVLKLPQNVWIVSLIPVGYTDRVQSPPPKFDPKEFTYYETYGNAKD
jgi:nitroreductase